MTLIFGFIVSIIGIAYMVYAKKSTRLSFAISGAALTVVSFVPLKFFYIVGISVILILFPFFAEF
ncbi:hypothetical protein [Hippea alviniae]|uniref:hypothetical protein n=1 Tax=Hippea alviniae TaxID=1279027 RepID=UPI0003B44276|nr:hypothetical protein [Hippea alviniae]